MKIRSITYFCDPHYPLDEQPLRAAGDFVRGARAAYEAAGYEVQSTRLATVPFARLLSAGQEAARWDELPRYARHLEGLIEDAGIPYASLGPALPEWPESYAAIPEALAATQTIFFGGVMADPRRGLDVAAVRRCADVIVRA